MPGESTHGGELASEGGLGEGMSRGSEGTRGNGWREGCDIKSNGMVSGGKQKLKHYTKVAYAEATNWMTRRLVRGGQISFKDAEGLAETWAEGATLSDIDPKIMEIEATNMAKQWARWHVPELGDLVEERPDGVYRFMLCQLNSASTEETKVRKLQEMGELVDKYEVQGLLLGEIGVNWSAFPSSYSLASWIRQDRACVAATAHNRHDVLRDGATLSKHQQGGVGLVAFKELMPCVRKKCQDFRQMGRFLSWVICVNPQHRTRLVVAYGVGRSTPNGLKTVYQQ